MYQTEVNFKAHVRTHSPDHDIKCKTCNKAFMLRGDLTRHMRRHNNDLKFSCPQCKQSFLRKYHLKRHIDNKHTKTLRPEDMCRNQCGNRHSRHVYPHCTACARELGVKQARGIREAGASLEACRCFDAMNEMFGLQIEHVHYDKTNCAFVSGRERDDWISDLKVRADGYEKEPLAVHAQGHMPNHVYEYLGRHWHGEPGTERHASTMARLQLFADNGYIVHFVWSDEWARAKTFREKVMAVHVLSAHTNTEKNKLSKAQ